MSLRKGRVEVIVGSGGRTFGDEVGDFGGDFRGDEARSRAKEDILPWLEAET